MSRLDVTERTLAQAERTPQWARLIETVHKAQAAKGFEGQHFGPEEVRHFGITLIGMPWEKPLGTEVYWAERSELRHSDGGVSVRYTVRAVYSDDFTRVHNIAERVLVDPTPEDNAGAVAEFARRAAWQVGADL